MTRIFALVLFAVFLLPFEAQAQSFPALYDVAGVASDDVLNIRLDTSASSEKIGSLAPTERDVEVIRRDETGAWGLVNLQDINGWVSMRYLARQPGQEWGVFPQAVRCFGTEPFWSVALSSDDTLRLDTPDGEGDFGRATRFVGSTSPDRLALRADGLTWQIVGVLAYSMCNDGMSNNEYGMSFDMLLKQDSGSESLLSGCCSLAP